MEHLPNISMKFVNEILDNATESQWNPLGAIESPVTNESSNVGKYIQPWLQSEYQNPPTNHESNVRTQVNYGFEENPTNYSCVSDSGNLGECQFHRLVSQNNKLIKNIVS